MYKNPRISRDKHYTWCLLVIYSKLFNVHWCSSLTPSSCYPSALSVPQKPQILESLQSYNSPGDWAGELSKPSTNSTSLVVKIEKKRFCFCWGISEGDVTKKACFENFGHLWPAVSSNPLTHSFGSKFCWKLRQNPRLYSLDWPASISVAKIMGQKSSFWPNSKLFRKSIICPFTANFGQP